MINVKQAHAEALKLTDAKYLKKILAFDMAFGFIFGDSKTEVDMGALCIVIDKNDPTQSAFIPIVFENLDFLKSGKDLPLSIIK